MVWQDSGHHGLSVRRIRQTRRSLLQRMVGICTSTVGLSLLSSCQPLLPERHPPSRQVKIGVLSPAPADSTRPLWQALQKYGWASGDNLLVEHRQAAGPSVNAVTVD